MSLRLFIHSFAVSNPATIHAVAQASAVIQSDATIVVLNKL